MAPIEDFGTWYAYYKAALFNLQI